MVPCFLGFLGRPSCGQDAARRGDAEPFGLANGLLLKMIFKRLNKGEGLMKQKNRWVSKGMVTLLPLLFLGACAPHHHVDPVTDTITATYQNTAFIIKQDTGSYCKAGEVWGGRLRDQQGALYGAKRTDDG
ncbi:MAG: hypothetical protein HQL94_11640, partial [Magnetococcales bacterium]|nr:hypothetical protein [Magnetococcales bacterium]